MVGVFRPRFDTFLPTLQLLSHKEELSLTKKFCFKLGGNGIYVESWLLVKHSWLSSEHEASGVDSVSTMTAVDGSTR